MRVLLTGGAGYIGSHTAITLIEHGHDVVIVDDLSNSSEEAVRRAARLVGRDLPLVVGDAADSALLGRVMREHRVDAVIHFASLKSPNASISHPLRYYRVNIDSALAVLEAMADCDVQRLVFSSSAAVYERPGPLLDEQAPSGLDLAHPYGRTKAMIEAIIADAGVANERLQAAVLRYFNPVGAHPSGEIGEDPQDIPNNLMPYISQVAAGVREQLQIFGGDYDTADGTGVRDYIHVLDLAEGHVAALEALEPGVLTVNLGTGRGVSVLEAVRAFEDVVGRRLPHRIVARRDGDSAHATANPALAHQRLGWRARRAFDEAVADAWRWQRANPRGYRS
ncbi:UDP-glucose 4-epimerase GalE [Agrococcus carbonis]|uniref:UDP-glucose 4-epimerase n=1 Tax=Agrococcus carbonis TaxID=684552 RepID=A0A1H1RH97_9MICO|nr:UDP-glucose 4-epimerase GalE [Agrococcus carbonis]SDS35078.1 UDP-glucose 4-epimerase [Agrococcus carbonis]